MIRCIICDEVKNNSRNNVCPRCRQRLDRPIYQGPIRLGDWFSHMGFVWDVTDAGKIVIRYEDHISANDTVFRGMKEPKYREVTENLLRTYPLRTANELGKEIRKARKSMPQMNPVSRILSTGPSQKCV